MAVHRSVYRPASAPLTEHGRLIAAVLACGDGALASHSAAAWLWGLDDYPSLVVSVFGTKSAQPRGVRVHRVKRAATPSQRHGIPVTNPLRTMVDLAAHASPEHLMIAVDRGVAARLFTPDALRAELDRSGRLPGMPSLRAALDEIAAVSTRSPSVLQNVFARVLARAGLPPPVPEVPVLSGRYRLDFAYPDAMLAFELDGREFHEGWREVEADHRRRRLLAALGWTVLVFTADDVWRQPDRTVNEIREELLMRGVHCEETAAGGRRRPPHTRLPAPETRAEERAPPSA